MCVCVHEAGANDALKIGVNPLFANLLDYSFLNTQVTLHDLEIVSEDYGS
jgi:hypothetical protein